MASFRLLRQSRTRLLVAVAAAGLPLSQLGHFLWYTVRYGSDGLVVQSQGAHAYFPDLLKASTGLLGGAVLGSLLVVGLVRLLVGRGLGLRPMSRQPFIELFVTLAAVQVDTYLLQETLETICTGQQLTGQFLLTAAGSAVVAQLPVALLAALALGWLSIRFGRALRVLRLFWRCPRPPLPDGLVVVVRPATLPTPGIALSAGFPAVVPARGPPNPLH